MIMKKYEVKINKNICRCRYFDFNNPNSIGSELIMLQEILKTFNLCKFCTEEGK